MKILLCGKGGSGKSTIAPLLAKKMASEDNSVLVIDTDESNFGLHNNLEWNSLMTLWSIYVVKKHSFRN